MHSEDGCDKSTDLQATSTIESAHAMIMECAEKNRRLYRYERNSSGSSVLSAIPFGTIYL